MPTKFSNYRLSVLQFFSVLISLIFISGFLPLDAQDKASTWTEVNVSGPSARHDHAMVYDATRKKIVVFAGESGSGGDLSDQWEWNGKQWEKISVVAPYPYIRTEHAMAYHMKKKMIVLFGGWRSGWGNPYRNDTWVYRNNKWEEIDTPGPSGRSKHAMAYDEKRKVVVLYGGYDGNDRLNDTWTFNGTKWTKLNASGPPGLLNHALAYDAKRKVIVLFGGYSDAGYSGETWILKGNQWKKMSSTGPSGRSRPSMAFSKKGNVVVLFGGKQGDYPYYEYLDDTWLWNGKNWTQFDISGPEGRSSHTMAYDIKRKRVVLFGGDPEGSWNALGDTWLFKK
ncbi:MAG: hypothetical protein JW755_12030 [Candidatus Aminicenantes bacterium]|nr:hypothetical protein [Candidatus Aminicenantes bacterium]